MKENDILIKQKNDDLNISTLHRAFNFYLNNFYCYTDCIFIDIGSNTGNFVKVLKRFDIKNNIHCFEPNNVSSITTKETYPYLIMNNYCLGNIDGFTDILEKSFDVSSSRPALPRLNEEVLNVECKKLDTYCELNNITKIDFIKIDVKWGANYIFEGASKMLESNKIQCGIFEIGNPSHDDNNTKIDEIVKTLENYGYNVNKQISQHMYIFYLP